MSPAKSYKVGDLRAGQFIYTFGVGGIVDLPHMSAIVSGLDDWPSEKMTMITEERLLEAVRTQLSAPVTMLRKPSSPDADAPPAQNFAGTSPPVGVPVVTFPRWLHCPACKLLASVDTRLFELKPDPFHPDRTKYVHDRCRVSRNPTAVPARFVVACKRGHIADFPWHFFVHGGPNPCKGILSLEEKGSSGQPSDLFVRCRTCGAGQALMSAFDRRGGVTRLPPCPGSRPHLGQDDCESCDQELRPILLGASNSWFPATLSALTIPASGNKIDQLVAADWANLSIIQDLAIVKALRHVQKLGPLVDYRDDEILLGVQRRRAGAQVTTKALPSLKEPEWQHFVGSKPSLDCPEFWLESATVPARLAHCLEEVVLVKRLRAVTALVGFTRLDAPNNFGEPQQELKLAPLCRGRASWVPVAEVRGEGIFIKFQEDRLAAWCSDPAVRLRDEAFRKAHVAWRRKCGVAAPEENYPGIRFILLHSFAHALLRQFSISCGYTASSLRERIYSRDPDEAGGPMAGVLFYTAAPDSEGTLGGLVRLGEDPRLATNLEQALARLGLCASDPLCAEHEPGIDERTLHGAACHACLFIPETSCERNNKYLDRSTVTGTVHGGLPSFFSPGSFAATEAKPQRGKK